MFQERELNGLAAGDETVEDLVARIARELLPRADEIAAQVAGALAAEYDDIDRLRIRDVVEATCRTNARRLLTSLAQPGRSELIPVSDDLHELTRDLYRRSVPEQMVIRLYRASIGHSIATWSRELGRRDLPAAAALEAIDVYLGAILRLLEELDSTIVEDYEGERIRLSKEWSLARLEAVRDVLNGDEVNVTAVSSRLGYRVSGRHMAAVLADSGADGDSGSRLEMSVKTLQQLAGPGLVVRVDMRTMWCWLPEAAFDDVVPVPGVRIGIGLPGDGLIGFRRSHAQALEALRVAELMPTYARSAITFREAEIVALCTVDPDRARGFVRNQLGPLIENTESAERMRETLAAFYTQNCSFRGAGAVLNLHHNTVRYRIDQIEALLERPLVDEKLAKHLALHLYHVIGAEVLDAG